MRQLMEIDCFYKFWSSWSLSKQYTISLYLISDENNIFIMFNIYF